jgi:Kef-type K+ transport system membrane component KefB
LFAHFVSGVSGPAAIVIGNGLALSSTAVVLQVNLPFHLENFNLVSQSHLQVD